MEVLWSIALEARSWSLWTPMGDGGMGVLWSIALEAREKSCAVIA
jgi:hypothetical protein